MKAIILAAGQGTRLKPLTNDIPKGMVCVAGKPIIQYQIEAFNKCGIYNISIVKGYKREKINFAGIKEYCNSEFESTNMVYSLMCAEKEFDDELIVSYGDIIYSPEVLQNLIDQRGNIIIASDINWLAYWTERFENPLDDAETFITDKNGLVLSLGKRAKSYEEIEGQYIGLIKFSKTGISKLKSTYYSCLENPVCCDNAWGSNRNLRKAYMTDILNYLASQKNVNYTAIKRGWFEIDSVKDLDIAEKYFSDEIRST